MPQLTLVRHAEASWDDPELSDFERPLNERGRRDAPRMAQWAKQEIGAPDLIVTSPALRALGTARVFAATLGFDTDHVQIQERIYEASLATLLRLLRNFDDAHGHVMLFGHNPGLGELAHALARCPFNELPPCAVVQIELDIEHWALADAGCGRLLRYQFPRTLLD